MLSHTDKSERLAQRKQCEHCGEWLMTKSGIYYHEQIHTSGTQKCDQCNMELPHKIALLAHIRKYHRERNFKCSYCDKSFPVSSELKVNIVVHIKFIAYLSMTSQFDLNFTLKPVETWRRTYTPQRLSVPVLFEGIYTAYITTHASEAFTPRRTQTLERNEKINETFCYAYRLINILCYLFIVKRVDYNMETKKSCFWFWNFIS